MMAIKTKFGFFQMQIKGMFRYAIELCQASFGKAPERLDTVNMSLTTDKFIVSMMHPEVLVKTNIDQPVVAAPSIRMNHGSWRYMATDNGLQCRFRAIWHNLCVDFSLPFQNTKDDRFSICSSASFTSNTLCTIMRSSTSTEPCRAIQARNIVQSSVAL